MNKINKINTLIKIKKNTKRTLYNNNNILMYEK